MENKAHDEPSKLPYRLLKQITNDFHEDRVLGSGGFGKVYKGVYENGREVAVKVLHNISGLDDKEFHKEFDNLKGLNHPNIVELVGYCNESEEELVMFEGKQVTAERVRMALCLEYVHNGSLNKLITDKITGSSWPTRYKIIKGICEGIKYLREGLEHPIMHFDLKPGNILLDKDMVPKIADFGLSRIFGEENTKKTISSMGTCGYWPPEYVKHQIISKEFDIFSLGVIIVKIMSGHQDYNQVAERTTRESVTAVYKYWRKMLLESCTPFFEVCCYQVKRCIEVALNCLKSNRQERPTIQDIVSSLNETETLIGDREGQIEKFKQDVLGESFFPSKSNTISAGPFPASMSTHGKNYSEPKVMTFQEIEYMTDRFSEARIIAEGENGKVYKGICEDGKVLAVKVLSSKRALGNIFRSHKRYYRVIAIENPGIIRLVGYYQGPKSKFVGGKEGYVYDDEMQRIACFEYLQNGSLERHISGIHSGLDWHTRYGIIKGTCMGLRYLHKEHPPIYHLNLKPSNILLDMNMQPKIDDLSAPDTPYFTPYILRELSLFIKQDLVPLAKIGSVDYMPPEFVEKQVISEKYDIYSLGVVIIEIMTGDKYGLGILKRSSEAFFVEVCLSWRKRLEETVEGPLVEGFFRQVTNCLRIALECVRAESIKRPTILNIVHRLNKREKLIHCKLLDVHPQELCFVPRYPRKKASIISCSLQLNNEGNDRVAFMLGDRSPTMRYSTKKLCGIVPPRCAYTLILTISSKQLVSSSSYNNEFFTLKSVAVCEYDLLDVDKNSISVEYEKFFKKASGDELHRASLKVICDLTTEQLETSSEPEIEVIATPDAQQVSSIDVHPTQPWIITTNNVGSLRVWNYETMAMLNWSRDVTDEPVYVSKFIAREKWLIAGDCYGSIHVYSYDQNQDIKSFDAHDSCITTLDVHPIYPFMLSSSSDDYNLIKLWDWNKSWECTLTFQGHTDRVTQVMFNPEDKDSFASSSRDGTIKIWSIYSNDPSSIITLKLEGHVDSRLCFDYFTRFNRQYMIVGCREKTAQVWKLGNQECVDKLEGHGDPISAVNLHPEIPILITGSLDGTVCIWNSTTYKLENIIGFNLGAVYAFRCIEGSRRIVVGCHQGMAILVISFPSLPPLSSDGKAWRQQRCCNGGTTSWRGEKASGTASRSMELQ